MIRALLAGLFLLAWGAQAPAPRLLVTSTDPQTGDVQLAWVDLAAGEHIPLARFSSSSACPSQRLPDSDLLLYQPEVFGQTAYVYQVNLVTGAALPFDSVAAWSCPAVTQPGERIAWTAPTAEATDLLLTDIAGDNPTPIATHDGIERLRWSPDGETLVYTVLDDADPTFRGLWAYTDAANAIWPREAGLVSDYAWLPDSRALIVAYWTQDHALLGRIESACLFSGEGPCPPQPLVRFPQSATLILGEAFSADGRFIYLIEERSRPDGILTADIHRVDVQDGGAQRLTQSPDLYKSGLVGDDTALYFVGTRFNLEAFAFEDNALYQLIPGQEAASPVYQAPDFFPLTILAYDP